MVMDRAARLAYLGMTNVFALLRLLPGSTGDGHGDRGPLPPDVLAVGL